MTDHTATPWFVGRKFEIGPRPSTDDQSDGMLHPVADVYGDNREADAAFICKAVNNHDALVKALTAIDTLAVCTGVVDPTLHYKMLCNIADLARAALSQLAPAVVTPGDPS